MFSKQRLVIKLKAYKTMNIVDAVELLSNIADLELDQEVGILVSEDAANGRTTFKTVGRVSEEDRVEGLHAIETAFKNTLDYLIKFYKEEFAAKDWEATRDRIKSLMVMVGDSANKLDAYGEVVEPKEHKSLKRCREYRNLQEFYKKNIAGEVVEGTLGKWILEAAKGAWGTKDTKVKASDIPETSRIYIDLESVKNDTEYELFYLRKEDGGRFFSPQLIRNIKLVSDFGDFVNKSKPGDLLTDIDIWQDRTIQHAALEMVRYSKTELNLLFKDLLKHRDHYLVEHIVKAALALIAASNPHNVKREAGHKACANYLEDFLGFYRKALLSDEYQRLIAYPPKKSHIIGRSILQVMHGLSRAMFEHKGYLDSCRSLIRHLMEEGGQKADNTTLWKCLDSGYRALDKVIKTHPNGPLNKVIDTIVRGQYHQLQPITPHNFPGWLYNIYLEDYAVAVLRLPSPTSQESIAKAEIIPEYAEFLRADEKHFTVNLQDRTLFKECARAFALESGDVISIPVDTEFYHQASRYSEIDDWDDFSDQLRDLACDPTAGYWMNEELKEKIEPIVPQLIEMIHSLYFQNRKELNVEERKVFIDIFYFFLVQKAIGLVKPKSMAFVCKDGVDVSNSFSCLQWVFFELLSEENIKREKILDLETMLFLPPLLVRERLPLSSRFKRLLSAVKYIEGLREKLGAKVYSKLVSEALQLLVY